MGGVCPTENGTCTRVQTDTTRGLSGAIGPDREEPPGPRHTLQLVFSSVGEIDARADHQILDGARHQHLSCGRLRPDPGGYVDGKPAEVIATDLALPGVEAGSKPQSQTLGGLPDRPLLPGGKDGAWHAVPTRPYLDDRRGWTGCSRRSASKNRRADPDPRSSRYGFRARSRTAHQAIHVRRPGRQRRHRRLPRTWSQGVPLTSVWLAHLVVANSRPRHRCRTPT